MLLLHNRKKPSVHQSAYVAPTATVCGDVTIGPGSRVMFGACVISEGQSVVLGENCVVMENAVIRGTDSHRTVIGAHCLIGPQAHLAGCTLEDCVFIATGACILHGAYVEFGVEVRVHAVVHLRTRVPAHMVVPIGWVAVGEPVSLLPPDQHESIWAAQKPLDFPKFVYGVERAAEGETNMTQITARRSRILGDHQHDLVLDRDGSERQP